jgi:hypothetical protein
MCGDTVKVPDGPTSMSAIIVGGVPVAGAACVLPAPSPVSKQLAPPPRVGYYVRDDAGRVSGPFSADELRRRAEANQVLPSWYVSQDRAQWVVAARVPKLFDVVESALARQLPPGKRLRDLTRAEQLGLLVDRFVLRDSDFLARFPVLKPLRRLIVRWTLPRTRRK